MDISKRIPAELKEAIRNDRLVIFAGAGLSYQLKNRHGDEIGGWGKLVKKILDDLAVKGHEVAHLIPLINHISPIQVLDIIETHTPQLPQRKIFKFTKDYFDLSDQENDFSLHKKLTLLCKKIITTNYDTAFEIAAPEYRKCKAFKKNNFELAMLREPDAKGLFKLHGCYEDSGSMVLFNSHYKDLYENDQRDAGHALMAMKNIIMNYTVLFIGTGMGDYQINNLFKEIESLHGVYNQQHFIITNKPLDSALSFLAPVEINGFQEIETVIDELLSIAAESQNLITEEHKKLQEQLKSVQAQLKELMGNLNPDIEEENDKIALKCFAKGLSYSLEKNYQQSIDQYEIVTCIKPNSHKAWNNWGNALGALAGKQSGKTAKTLYKEAFEKFRRSVKIKQNQHETWYNWAIYLVRFAATQSDEAAEKLYKEALEKYSQALEINENSYETLRNWGMCLGSLAAMQSGEAADTLYKEAFKKYARAVEIKEDQHKAWANWGITLGRFSITKQGDIAEKLHAEAIEKCQNAYKLSGRCYNLACMYALLDLGKDSALEYLEVSLNNEEVSKKYVLEDDDWHNLFDDSDFKALLAKF